MDKYTELEQVLQDPSLVIITDQITTGSELTKAYIKYKVLPKKQKRYSNYYSSKFLGHNVPVMFGLVREKLIDDSKARTEWPEWKIPTDPYVVSEPDLYYKEEEFNSGETNICFILGHSGSGKSRMAETLVGDDMDHIELDDLLLTRDHFTMDELKDYSGMMYSFFSGEGAKYYIGAEERDSIPKEEYEDRVFVDFIQFAMDYAKQHREKKFIIDGIWIYLYFDDPSVFQDYAVFIKGTSFLKSKIRATKREMQRDKETLQDRKQMFGREARNYFLDEEKINNFRSFFADRPETILREEVSDNAKMVEFMIGEIDRINECYVNEDADGINEIMKRAEENTELPHGNKMWIITECKSALAEL